MTGREWVPACPANGFARLNASRTILASRLAAAARSAAVALLLAAIGLMSGCAQFASSNHNAAGVALTNQGQQQAALARFQSALAANPTDPDANYNAARIYHTLGTQTKDKRYYQEAERLYNRCLDLDRNHAECNRSLAVLLVEDNRSDAAFRLMTNWVTVSPRNADARVELSRLNYEFGEKDKAKGQLEAAMRLEPYNPRVARALGALYEEAGQPAQALANYERSYYADNFQKDLVPRIASLQGQTMTSFGPSAQGTRIVTEPIPSGSARY